MRDRIGSAGALIVKQRSLTGSSYAWEINCRGVTSMRGNLEYLHDLMLDEVGHLAEKKFPPSQHRGWPTRE